LIKSGQSKIEPNESSHCRKHPQWGLQKCRLQPYDPD